jgi:hypothetical protein
MNSIETMDGDEPSPFTSQSTWRKELKQMLALEEGLNDWEVEFVDSLGKQAERTGFIPSKKQKDKLHQIWREH